MQRCQRRAAGLTGREGDVGLRMDTSGVLWRAYWLALVVSVPGVQSALAAKLDISLSLEQSDLGDGGVRVCIVAR